MFLQIIFRMGAKNRLKMAALGGWVSSKDLWKQINAFMTYAVAKNLKVEFLVAEELGSNHIPHHICEKLDE